MVFRFLDSFFLRISYYYFRCKYVAGSLLFPYPVCEPRKVPCCIEAVSFIGCAIKSPDSAVLVESVCLIIRGEGK